MPEIDSRGSLTHPIGWPFLGAGALFWLPPLLGYLELDWRFWILAHDTAWSVLIIIFGATILGLTLDPALRPLEHVLLWRSGLLKQNPSADKWAAAWRTRWRHATADAEFRRHEGMASFARVYSLHALLSTLLWPLATNDIGTRVLTVSLGLAVILLFVWIWYLNTQLIFRIVEKAHDWEGTLS